METDIEKQLLDVMLSQRDNLEQQKKAAIDAFHLAAKRLNEIDADIRKLDSDISKLTK